MEHKYYIGLDVHKESIAIACALEGDRCSSTYHGNCGGSVLSAERVLRALAKNLNERLRNRHGYRTPGEVFNELP